SALAEPVQAWFGTTAQLALAVWALPALVALLAWMRVARVNDDASTRVASGARVASGSAHKLPWRDSSAWLGTGFMALQSLLFYGALAWLPVSNMEHGMSARDAGLLLAL